MTIFSKASANLSKLFSISIYLLLILFLSSCQSFQSEMDASNENFHPAIYHQRVQKENLIYHLTTIALDHLALSITATEPTLHSSYETLGETTESFAKRTNSTIAINASPFSYPFTMLSNRRNIEGLYIYNREIISTPNSNYAALCFTVDKKAFITDTQKDNKISNAYYAFGGFWTILDGDKIYSFKDIKDARTAIGVSEDGNTLYILSVEKNNLSLGLNYMECAEILQNQGAHKAIQLDGGGSTSLIIPENLEKSLISQRKVANNIGFIVNY